MALLASCGSSGNGQEVVVGQDGRSELGACERAASDTQGSGFDIPSSIFDVDSRLSWYTAENAGTRGEERHGMPGMTLYRLSLRAVDPTRAILDGEVTITLESEVLDWFEAQISAGSALLGMHTFRTQKVNDNPAPLDGTRAPDGQAWAVLGLGPDGGLVLPPTCDGSRVWAEPLAEAAVAGKGSSRTAAEFLLAALTDRTSADWESLIAAAGIAGPAVQQPWSETAIDDRMIPRESVDGIARGVPASVYDSLQPFTVVVVLPQGWGKLPFTLCTLVPGVGWNDSCSRFDSGAVEGTVLVDGLMREDRTIELVIGRADEGFENPVGRLVEFALPPENPGGLSLVRLDAGDAPPQDVQEVEAAASEGRIRVVAGS